MRLSRHRPEQGGALFGPGQPPDFKWVAPEASRGSVYPKTSMQSRAWRWMADRVQELQQLQGCMSSGAGLHRTELIVRLRCWKPPSEHADCKGVYDEGVEDIRGRLEDADAAAAGLRRWAKHAFPHDLAGGDWWIQEGHRLATKYDSRFRSQGQNAWRRWSVTACEAGRLTDGQSLRSELLLEVRLYPARGLRTAP